jgi:DNA glycosylase AlkZ-like
MVSVCLTGQNARVDDLLRLRAWSYARQRLGEPARSLSQALDAVVAVYATHPTAPLALWARTKSFTPARYRAFDRARKAVRLPAMRRTVFLVPNKNAAQIFTAVRAKEAHSRRQLKQVGLSAEAYERHAKKILRAAREPLSRKDLEEAVGIDGAKLGPVLRALRFEGRMLTLAGDSLLMSPHRFVATDSWLADGLDAGNTDRALAWLAREYLRGYGPARVEDFAWWTGVTRTAAKKAIERHDTIDVGEGRRLLAKDTSEFERVDPLRDSVALLPKWDAYTMGFAPDGRRRFVHPDAQERVYTPIGTGLSGDGNPLVLLKGEAVATWTFSLKEGAKLQPFDKLTAKSKKRVHEKLDEIAGLLS